MASGQEGREAAAEGQQWQWVGSRDVVAAELLDSPGQVHFCLSGTGHLCNYFCNTPVSGIPMLHLITVYAAPQNKIQNLHHSKEIT